MDFYEFHGWKLKFKMQAQPYHRDTCSERLEANVCASHDYREPSTRPTPEDNATLNIIHMRAIVAMRAPISRENFLILTPTTKYLLTKWT